MGKHIGPRLEEFYPFWLETPVRTSDLAGHVEVAKAIRFPMVRGEGFAKLRQLVSINVPSNHPKLS